jgi:hypothetical protein
MYSIVSQIAQQKESHPVGATPYNLVSFLVDNIEPQDISIEVAMFISFMFGRRPF